MDGETIDIKSLAEDVEKRYERDFKGKFPYDDCYAIQKSGSTLAASIIPNLDEYFSFIAGYSSSATRLGARSQEELRTAIPKLNRSFFDKHPEYKPLAEEIARTTILSRKMRVADELRKSLVTIMEYLLDGVNTRQPARLT